MSALPSKADMVSHVRGCIFRDVKDDPLFSNQYVIFSSRQLPEALASYSNQNIAL
jgi:hypothetical protein